MADWLDDVDNTDDESEESTENEEVEEVETEESTPEPEPEEVDTSESEDVEETPDTPGGVDVSSLAPDVTTGTEASEQEYIWRTYWWAGPGMGKTHGAFTSPSPVCVIDTEGKADALAHKFSKRGEYDDPFIWTPGDYDEVQEALDQAIALLTEFEEKEGVKGTIVVDSMSDMWRWSKEKHLKLRYGGKDLADVNLQSEIGEGQGDWKHIKKWHNTKFRQRLVECGFHLALTDIEKDDIGEKLSSGETLKKFGGERDNDYKAANHVIRIVDGPDGIPVGIIEKSDIVKWKVTGLERPTFPKVKEVIETIRDVGEDKAKDYIEGEIPYDVEIQESKPKRAPDYYAWKDNE